MSKTTKNRIKARLKACKGYAAAAEARGDMDAFVYWGNEYERVMWKQATLEAQGK